ncbi:hypothetical protein GCM10011575_18610 [Microlunatus endophyticus]|uniref:CHY-type domain-containing protein n=1 Tax=Microlunatus endophyticus TaxID=1716077 RepID=A0A917W3M8_9ACTN|nr:CHY zinc finger protein [Microlunatus endophyticus]GGL60365.1 hypothetical protein GCM10011575_18610 [Microlunatus endophyticus]
MSRPTVRGAVIDDQTRCRHWHGPYDVVAIKFACCGDFYPCISCHAEATEHPVRRWPISQRADPAVLCGVCGHLLTIDDYLVATSCPACSAAFNPRCSLHHHLYFELAGETGSAAPDPNAKVEM